MTTEEKNCKDMADVCELAHERTVAECERRGLPVNCASVEDCGDDGQDHDDDADGTHYAGDAQDIFNGHYDRIAEATGL